MFCELLSINFDSDGHHGWELQQEVLRVFVGDERMDRGRERETKKNKKSKLKLSLKGQGDNEYRWVFLEEEQDLLTTGVRAEKHPDQREMGIDELRGLEKES